MKKLPRPVDEHNNPFSVEVVFRLCIRDTPHASKVQLEEILRSVVDASNLYDQEASNGHLYRFPRNNMPVPVENDDMVNLYTNRMVPVGQAGRPIYDKIKNAAPHARCPLCDVGQVTTLDHH